MTTSPDRVVAVIGAGVVGRRAARLLAPNPVLLMNADGPIDEGPEVPPGAPIAVTVLAGPAGVHGRRAAEELARGRHVVSCSDDPEDVEDLLALDQRARAVGRTVVVGAAFSPGLSCLLASWAVRSFDEVISIRVARAGAAGPACARRRAAAARSTGRNRRDGQMVVAPAFSGRELVWFPEPVGARDCFHGGLPEARLLEELGPGRPDLVVRAAASRRNRVLSGLPMILPPPSEGGIGAVRVDVTGRRAGAIHDVVLGVAERPGIGAALVVARAVSCLLDDRWAPGAAGLAVLESDPAGALAWMVEHGMHLEQFNGSME